MGIQIYANIDAVDLPTGRVQSAGDLRPKEFKQLVAGDSAVFDVFLTGQDGLQDIQSYPTVRLGIGEINARPDSGSWALGGEEITYNASASDVQTSVASEVAPNTTTEVAGFVYKVVFDANGAQTIPAVDASSLSPSSTVSIKRLVTGDASTQEVWLIRIYQNPIALIETGWTNISGSGIRGALNLGTEGIYELLGSASSATTSIELELTDTDGNVQTIFQSSLTIRGEVVGEGVTGVATFDSYVQSSALTNGTYDLDVATIETDTLNVTSTATATFSGDISVSGDASVDGAITAPTASFSEMTAEQIHVTGSATSTFAGDVLVEGLATFSGGLYASTVRVNGGGTVEMFQRYSTSQNFGSIAGHTTATATFTATGISTSALTFAACPDAIADPFVVSAKPTASDVVELQIHNTASTSESAPTATYNILAVQFT